ncbi:MAG: hypothetical protein WC344_05125 [Bacilli bacterium]
MHIRDLEIDSESGEDAVVHEVNVVVVELATADVPRVDGVVVVRRTEPLHRISKKIHTPPVPWHSRSFV